MIHKEVAISQVFSDNINYCGLFYSGRFDFVVYEVEARVEIPVLAIELDGKEHFEDEIVKERDRKKMKSAGHIICRLFVWKIRMPEDITISSRYC